LVKVCLRSRAITISSSHTRILILFIPSGAKVIIIDFGKL
jgi:hypothetical protein